MQWDTQSVFLTGSLVGLVVLVFSWSLAAARRKAPWFLLWALGNTMLVVGVGLYTTQGVWHPALSIVTANALVMAGILTVARGLESFAGQERSWWWDGGVLAALVGLFVLFTFVWPTIAMRVAVVSLLNISALVRFVLVLSRKLPEERQLHPVTVNGLAVGFVLLAMTYGVRIAGGFLEHQVTVLTPSAYVVATYLSTLMGFLLWTLGFVSLATWRDQRLMENALASRDRLLTLVAHDLRGPVGALADLLTYLRDGQPPADEARQIIIVAADSARDNSTLLQTLLDWATAENGQATVRPEMWSLAPLLAEAVAPLAPQAMAKQIEVQIDCPADVQAFVDARMFTSMVRNLVSNAVKFTPVGGRVEVAATRMRRNTAVDVRDSGPGMPADVESRLNRGELPRSTLGTSGEKGTGLGLSLCLAFARANHGSLLFQSTDHGTTVRVLVPARP